MFKYFVIYLINNPLIPNDDHTFHKERINLVYAVINFVRNELKIDNIEVVAIIINRLIELDNFSNDDFSGCSLSNKIEQCYKTYDPNGQ